MRTAWTRVFRTQGAVAPRLSLMHAMNFIGIGLYMPFFPLWLALKGLDDIAIGLVLTIPILMRVIAASFVTGLGDGRVPPVLLLACLNGWAALLYLSLLPAEGIWFIGLIMALNAMAISGVVPLADMLTTAQIRAGVAMNYGHVRLWGSVSFFVANLLGGVLIARAGASVVPLALAISTGLAALAALAAPSPPAKPQQPAGDTTPRAGFPAAFWLAVAGAACVNAAHAALYGFGSLHWRSLGLTETTIGVLWAVSVAAEIALFLVAGGIVGRGVAGLRWIAAGGAAGAIRFALMAFDPGLGATLVLQLLHGVSFGCTHLGAMAVISALAPEGRRAAAQGRLVAVSALASAAATFASGYVYQRHGAGAFLAMVPLALAGLGFLALAKRHLPGDTDPRGGTGTTGRVVRAGREAGVARAGDVT